MNILDPNVILVIMIVSFLIGLITNLVSRNVGYIVSIVGTLPLIIFLIGSFISGTKIEDVSEIGDWVIVYITGLVPLVLSYAAAIAGAGLVTGGRRARRN